jgi:cytidylate kinase
MVDMIIAVDGPAGSGKSTIAQAIAARLGFTYLDTGAMYRAVTLVALEGGTALDDGVVLGRLAAEASITFLPALETAGEPELEVLEPPRVFVGGREVTRDIRTQAVTHNVSEVSAHREVRGALTERQRELAEAGNVIMDGRDIGTVVCPGADVKIYLTASVDERAERRQRQLEAQGLLVDLETIRRDMVTRDAFDSGRSIAPLRKAEDAVEIDTTDLTIAQVVHEVESRVKTRRQREKGPSCEE